MSDHEASCPWRWHPAPDVGQIAHCTHEEPHLAGFRDDGQAEGEDEAGVRGPVARAPESSVSGIVPLAKLQISEIVRRGGASTEADSQSSIFDPTQKLQELLGLLLLLLFRF